MSEKRKRTKERVTRLTVDPVIYLPRQGTRLVEQSTRPVDRLDGQTSKTSSLVAHLNSSVHAKESKKRRGTR